MLKDYTAPNGRTYQFEEGTQPEGYKPVAAARPKAKQGGTKNKAGNPEDK